MEKGLRGIAVTRNQRWRWTVGEKPRIIVLIPFSPLPILFSFSSFTFTLYRYRHRYSRLSRLLVARVLSDIPSWFPIVPRSVPLSVPLSVLKAYQLFSSSITFATSLVHRVRSSSILNRARASPFDKVVLRVTRKLRQRNRRCTFEYLHEYPERAERFSHCQDIVRGFAFVVVRGKTRFTR